MATLTTKVTGGTLSLSGSTSVTNGDSRTITMTPTTDGASLTQFVINGISYLGDVQETTTTTTQESTYTVTKASGASYEFTLGSDGYYVSGNAGVNSSASVSVVTFDLKATSTITFTVINYAESRYDYGIMSNVDTTLSTSYSADSSNVKQSFRSKNSSSTQTVTYDSVSAGSHYIYVKYRKDSSQHKNNDSFKFKISISPTGASVTSTAYTYTYSDIQCDSEIVAEFGSDSICSETISISPSDLGTVYPYIYNSSDLYTIAETAALCKSGSMKPPNVYKANYSTGLNWIIVPNDGTNVKSVTGSSATVSTTDNDTYVYAYCTGVSSITLTVVFSETALMLKSNGSWVTVSKVYKKVNGSWVEQDDLSSLFDTTANYVKG